MWRLLGIHFQTFIIIIITSIILEITHRPVFYLKQRFRDWILSSSSGGTYRGTIDIASLCLRKTGRWKLSRIAIVILLYHRHKPTDLIDYCHRVRPGITCGSRRSHRCSRTSVHVTLFICLHCECEFTV
jgi:hypothetical protein